MKYALYGKPRPLRCVTAIPVALQQSRTGNLSQIVRFSSDLADRPRGLTVHLSSFFCICVRGVGVCMFVGEALPAHSVSE